MSFSRTQKRHSIEPLQVGYAAPSELDAKFLMQRARNCANSDECSLEEAEVYLSDILRVQSGCASGALLGQDICDNQDIAAEVVASLRAKIERGTETPIR